MLLSRCQFDSLRQFSPGDRCCPLGDGRAALWGAATSYAVGARVGATTMLAPSLPGGTDVHSVAGNPKLDLFDSGSVELPPLTRPGARREVFASQTPTSGPSGAARRGRSRGRAGRAFDVHTTPYLHTTKNLARRAPSSLRRSRGWTWRRRRSPGTAARPASESASRATAGPHRRRGGLDDYFPRASQLSHRAVVPPSLTYTVNTAR